MTVYDLNKIELPKKINLQGKCNSLLNKFAEIEGYSKISVCIKLAVTNLLHEHVTYGHVQEENATIEELVKRHYYKNSDHLIFEAVRDLLKEYDMWPEIRRISFIEKYNERNVSGYGSYPTRIQRKLARELDKIGIQDIEKS